MVNRTRIVSEPFMNAAPPSIVETQEATVTQSPEPVATPAKPAQAALPLRLAIGLIGMLLASLTGDTERTGHRGGDDRLQGAFSIGHDDGTWLTALFEATNVATMVFAPWFGITFTLKRFTIGAVMAMMFFGFLCPFAPNLLTLYVLRALQGVAGGCLPPMLIIVALRYLPPKVKLYGLAGYALTATFGPALGTPLAALWTEYVSWQMASGKSCRLAW